MSQAFRWLLVATVWTILGALPASALAAEPDGKVYEMRIYHAAPGKLEALHQRFREHTVKLFEKHGMTNIGYFVPLENAGNRLIYFLAFPSAAARGKSWVAFLNDPEWKRVFKATEATGPLVTKIESTVLTPTDYSPSIRPSAQGDRVFELRVYTATPGHLADLNARFRDHTVALFARHGMTSIGYWVPRAGQKGADHTLVYILAHPSVDAAKTDFDAFRKDPDWIAAKKESEEKAGGSLTVKDGVKSTFMKATDYSPMK